MKKSQISVEILFIIGFTIFVFIILLAFTMERRHEIGEIEETFEEKAECYKLSNLISGVYNSNSGTGLIETLKYRAEIDADEGSIFIGEGRYFCTFPISSVENTDYPGETIFNLEKGSITLNNTDGVVKIINA